MRYHKFMFMGFIGAILIVGILLFNSNLIPTPKYSNENNKGENIQLIVDYDNGTVKIIKDITVIANNNTVFDVLQAFCMIKYKEYTNDAVFIYSIDNIENKNPYYWQYWVNDTYAPVGASHYYLSDADEIEWKYGFTNF